MTKSIKVTTSTARLCLGLLLGSLSLTVQAAQPEVTQFELLSFQLAHTNTKQLDSYQLSTAVANTTASNFVFGKMPHLPSISEIKTGTFWTTSIRWHYTDDGFKSSFTPKLRIESKESRIELNPLKHSFSLAWRRAL
jgi:hypothetical protein